MADFVIINDEPVNFHFPDHYKYVYLDLLKKVYNIDTKMIVTEKGNSNFYHENILLKLKKSSTKNIFKRVFYSLYIMINIFKVLMFNKEVKGVKYIMVHDEPIIAFIAFVVSKIKGCKFIYRITHLKAEEVAQTPGLKFKILAGFAKGLRNFLLKKADAVIVMSEKMKKHFKPIIKKEIYNIASCIKLYSKEPIKDIPENIKQLKQKITPDSLCYLGTISSFRGLGFIVNVMAKLHEKGLKKELNIFGKGTEKDFINLNKKIVELNLQNHIFLHSQIPMEHLRYVLQDVKIGLSPYLYDENYILKYNSPLKTLDYMSFRKFVVGSDIDDHNETILDSKSGVISKNNVEDFSNAIIKLDQKLKNLSQDDIENKIKSFTIWLEENRSLNSNTQRVYNVLNSLS